MMCLLFASDEVSWFPLRHPHSGPLGASKVALQTGAPDSKRKIRQFGRSNAMRRHLKHAPASGTQQERGNGQGRPEAEEETWQAEVYSNVVSTFTEHGNLCAESGNLCPGNTGTRHGRFAHGYAFIILL